MRFSSLGNDMQENAQNGNGSSLSNYFNYNLKNNGNLGSRSPYKELRFSTSVDDIQVGNPNKNGNDYVITENPKGELRYSYSVNDFQDATQKPYGKGSFSNINNADYFNYSPRVIEIPNVTTENPYGELKSSTSVKSNPESPAESSPYGKGRFSNNNNSDYSNYCPAKEENSIPIRKISNLCYGVLDFPQGYDMNESNGNSSFTEIAANFDKKKIDENPKRDSIPTADQETAVEKRRRKRQSRYSTSSCYDNHR